MFRFIKLLIFAVLFNMPLFSQEVENKQELHKKCSGCANVSVRRSAEKTRQLNNYDVKHYLLDIEVSPLNTKIKGSVSIQAVSVVEGLSDVALELVDTMKVDSVFVDEEKQAFSHRDNMINVTLNQPISKDSLFKVTIYYKGISDGRGVTQAYNSSYGFNVTWSLSESFHAKEWWPCKEVLTDKADSATIILTTNKKYKAVSNGILLKTEAVEADKMKYYWKTRFPINYYLISFAVADYREHNFSAPVNENGDSVFVQNFIYNSDLYLEDNKKKIEATSELMEIYSELFGLYPYSSEKYGHAISELGGGMEHQTITTLGNFSFLLVAHELAHQWFGDYVTCSSWQDIWINEGFASYGEYLALEFSGQQEEAKEWMRQAHKLVFNEPGGSVYVPFEEINNESRIFNFYLSYKKGASIIHMIRYKLGDDDLFFSVLKGFLQKYKHSNASGEDFMNYLNNITDKDFSGFFDDWYYGKGYPEYHTRWSRQNDLLTIELEQNHSFGEMNVFEIPVELKITSANGDTLIKMEPDSRITEVTIDFKDEVEDIIVDPANWILNKDKHFTPLEKQPKSPSPVRVYPNPFDTYLKVDFSSGSMLQKTIIVRRMDGSQVYSTIVKKNSLYINTQKWPGGVYLLEFIENKSHLCIKAVKY